MEKKLLIMKLNILGAEYKVYVDVPDRDDRLKTNDGYIVPEKKIIVLDRKNVDVHQQHVLKHEITHAFLYESGLDVETWANNEEIVDWIAIQLSKMSDTAKIAMKKLKPYYTLPKEKKKDAENTGCQEQPEDSGNA